MAHHWIVNIDYVLHVMVDNGQHLSSFLVSYIVFIGFDFIIYNLTVHNFIFITFEGTTVVSVFSCY